MMMSSTIQTCAVAFETVKARWDNRIAMYTGDYIFSRALTSIGEIEIPPVHRLLSKTMLEICRGEILQIEHQRKFDQTIRDYLRRIKRKTALLLSSSCELGALVSGADPTIVRKMSRFGYFAGMSFQIIDDILDITSTDEDLGKPAGSDLVKWSFNITGTIHKRRCNVPSIYGAFV